MNVDAAIDEFNGSFHRFFPESITVHPGDTIAFRRPENGEPHTVSMGTRIPTSEAVPGGNFYQGGFGGLPRKDASVPCFIADRRPSPIDGCPAGQRTPLAFDGTQAWINSGGLLGDEAFTLEISGDIAPGSYPFVCLAHTTDMRGEIVVVDPEEPADDPAEAVDRGERELAAEVEGVQPLVDEPANIAEGEVAAGIVDASLFGGAPTAAAWANVFTPEEIEVPVGGTVTWNVRGLHAIAFNASESASPFYERAEDGSVRENPEGSEASGDPDAWDGAGVLNSGLLEGLLPPAEFTVTFTRAGTYAYQCLVHFDMEGRVKVGG